MDWLTFLHRHCLSFGLGLLFGERDRADRRVARQHAAASKHAIARPVSSPACSRCASADRARCCSATTSPISAHRRWRPAFSRAWFGEVGVALCHRVMTVMVVIFRRGIAEDPSPSRTGPGVVAGRAAMKVMCTCWTLLTVIEGGGSRLDAGGRHQDRRQPRQSCRRRALAPAQSTCFIHEGRSKSRTAICRRAGGSQRASGLRRDGPSTGW